MSAVYRTNYFAHNRGGSAAAGVAQSPRRLEIPERVRGMLGPVQTAQIARELAGEHSQDPSAGRSPTGDLLMRQDAQLSRLPAKIDQATARHLALARYSERGRSWYVLAYDAEASMAQCLIVARDVAEVGYISLKMLTATNVPMDLHYGAEPVQAVFQRHGIELPCSLAPAESKAEAAETERPSIRRRMH